MGGINVSRWLISGLAAAVRPRFGPGPKTAAISATALWFGGTLLAVIGFLMIGIYPTSMLVGWGVLGWVEMILAALVGGWLYREEEAAA